MGRLFALLWFCVPLLLVACGNGDDDGRRLGEIIAGAWYRGYAPGDVTIEGDTDLTPDNLTYDRFEFSGDGDYNGMVRKGTFESYDSSDMLINKGNYQCDNNNLKLQVTSPDPLTILAQVTDFSDDHIRLRYVLDQYNITVTLLLHRQRGTPAQP